MKKTLSLALTFVAVFSMFSMFTVQPAKAQEIIWNTNPTPIPNPAWGHSSIVHNEKIYVIGGMKTESAGMNNVYFANINSDGTIDSWDETSSLPNWRQTRTASVTWNSFVYVIGGVGPEGAISGGTEQRTVYYAGINPDGTIDGWSETTQLPSKLQNHAATVWNDRIYVIGGWNGYYRKNTIYIAEPNPADGSISGWVENPTHLPQGYEQMGVIVHDGMIYLMGGWRPPKNIVYYAPISETDGTIGPFAGGPPLPQALASVRTVLIGNDIYVVGGRTGDEVTEAAEKTVYKTTISGDGTLGDWIELQSIPETRMEHSLVTFHGGIYVIGGRNKTDGVWTAKDTIYYSSPVHAPSKWAVVIGVDEYHISEENVEGPSNSAIDMYSVLVDYMGFPDDEDHIHLLLDKIGVSTDDVTRAMVEEQLDWLEHVSIPEDTVVFYYAGHGWQSPTFGYEYIIMHDTDMADHEFAAEISDIKSENLCVILDISVSGGFIKDGQTFWEGFRGVGGEWSDLASETPSGRVVLTACAENVSLRIGRRIADRDAHAWPLWPSGYRYEMVFTHFLVEGLKGPADHASINKDDRVTVEEAFRYARLRAFIFPIPFFLSQTPMIYDGYPEYEVEGELYLGD